HQSLMSCPTRRSADLWDQGWCFTEVRADWIGQILIRTKQRIGTGNANCFTRHPVKRWVGFVLDNRPVFAFSLMQHSVDNAHIPRDRKSTRLNSSHVKI